MEQMNDQQRYELLKAKRIKVVPYNADKLVKTKEDLDALETRYRKEANKVLKPLAKKLGIIKTGYYNASIDLEFNYSNHNLDESTKKQTQIVGDEIFLNFAKMLSCFEEVINNAELIEIHRDDEGHNEAPNFLRAHVLVSAVKDGGKIIPVKLLVKEFDRMDNILYVTVTLQKINEAEVLGRRTLSEDARSRSTSVKISIADLLSNINDESLKKYIPEQFFDRSSL